MSQIWDDAAALVIVIHYQRSLHVDYQPVKVILRDFVEVSKELLMNFLVMSGVIYAPSITTTITKGLINTVFTQSTVVWKLVNRSLI